MVHTQRKLTQVPPPPPPGNRDLSTGYGKRCRFTELDSVPQLLTLQFSLSINYVPTRTKLGLEIIDRTWAGNLYVWSPHINQQKLVCDRCTNRARNVLFTAKTGDEDPAGCQSEIISLDARC